LEQSRLLLRNHHPARRPDLGLLRRITRALLHQELGREEYDLGFYLVDEHEMTHLNETFLQHKGSTDVITFDYCDPGQPEFLAGEIFICLDEARVQARRFRVSWQSELVRYVVHGLLHLSGFDDQRPAQRRSMKREEDRLLRALAAQFPLSRLARQQRKSRKPKNSSSTTDKHG
jgi:probable rRNA maturation factor